MPGGSSRHARNCRKGMRRLQNLKTGSSGTNSVEERSRRRTRLPAGRDRVPRVGGKGTGKKGIAVFGKYTHRETPVEASREVICRVTRFKKVRRRIAEYTGHGGSSYKRPDGNFAEFLRNPSGKSGQHLIGKTDPGSEMPRRNAVQGDTGRTHLSTNGRLNRRRAERRRIE